MNFLNDDKLIQVYQVQRFGDDSIEHIFKRSVIELDIHRNSSRRPYKMSASFWNCLRDAGQEKLEEEFNNAVRWPIDYGQAIYLKVSRNEYDSKTLSNSSVEALKSF